MILFAFMLPVIVGFLALSIAASIELNAQATLDQAVLTAAVGASSDACMSSPYPYDLYECTTGISAGSYKAAGVETAGGNLPQPPFTSSGGLPFTTANTICPPANCITIEHNFAQQSVDFIVKKILQADYPGFTIINCPVATPCATLVPNNTTIVFQDQVSYWYFLDQDDVTGGDVPSENFEPGGDYTPQLNVADGGSAPGTDSGSPNEGLVCPATQTSTFQQFSRSITVSVWSKFQNPFAGVLGINTQGLETSHHTFGCGGGV